MSDELPRIQGVAESAEVLDGDMEIHKCECCGFELQITGGIAISDGFKVIASNEHECPVCKSKIPLVKIETKPDGPTS